MRGQEHKINLGNAGEHLAAGELIRRGIPVAIADGGARGHDLVALVRDGVVKVQVKTTDGDRWCLGSAIDAKVFPPEGCAPVWVLVYLPTDGGPAEFTICTAQELRDVIWPGVAAQLAKSEAKYGKPWSGRGVYSVKRRALAEHRDRWNKVTTVTTRRIEEPPELTPQDDAVLDRIWDQIGREDRAKGKS